MLPKYHVRMHDVRPSNFKMNRSRSKANVSIYQTPKPAEKRFRVLRAETMEGGGLNESMEILQADFIGHGSNEDGVDQPFQT